MSDKEPAARRASSRRYGQVHKTVRKRWRLRVEAGGVACVRCGEPIKPGTPWDLGHVDGGRPGEYAGPEHRRCNRAQPAIEAWQARAAQKGEEDAVPRGRAASRWGTERWSRHWSGPYNEACPDCRDGVPCEAADDG